MMSGAGEQQRSVAFDRAADYYDATRAWSPEAQNKTVAILDRELAPRGKVLEIGVGTGRIALPLYRSGVAMTGLDLSRPMMSKLLEKAAGEAFPLVQGNATKLPFRKGAFGAGLIVHVLHLIPNWRDALDELGRVLRPGGAIVISIGDDRDEERSMWEEMTGTFRKEAGLPERFPGFSRSQEIDDAMRDLGATRRDLEPVPERKPRTAREIADLMESGKFSFTWDVDEETLRAAGERLRAWAVGRYGSLDAVDDARFTIPWRAYDLP